MDIHQPLRLQAINLGSMILPWSIFAELNRLDFHRLSQLIHRSYTMATQDYKFEGWLGLDPKSVEGNMVWQEFEPKPWEETDVDIQVTHSGICGSDIHTLRSGWVSITTYA